MPQYDYECLVFGQWDGRIEAKNKKEALEKAMEDLRMEGLYPDGEIDIMRVPKDEFN